MQKAKIASFATLMTPPLCNCNGVRVGVTPSAGTWASPARWALTKAVISSQPRKFSMKASGST